MTLPDGEIIIYQAEPIFREGSRGVFVVVHMLSAELREVDEAIAIVIQVMLTVLGLTAVVAWFVAQRALLDRDKIRFWVHDTGEGIPQAEQARIFERFAHASSSRRRSEGAGLGLAIVRAIALTRVLVPMLNRVNLRFSLSLLHDPADYARRDAAILRLCQVDWEVAVPTLRQAYSAVRSHLQRAVPLFTKSLAPGVGLAEEPTDEVCGDGLEFGLHRAQLVADALLESADPTTRLEATARQFRQVGLLLDKPYLSPGAGDRYSL